MTNSKVNLGIFQLGQALLFVIAFLSMFTIALGQAGHGKGRLTGIVIDENSEAVAAATISIRLVEAGIKASYVYRHPSVPFTESVVFETKTDKKGAWGYSGLATGVWEVCASKVGYIAARRRVQVHQLSANPRVELQLERQRVEMGSYSVAPELLEQANSCFSLNKFAEALFFYRQYLERDPESIMVKLAVGDCLRELGRIDEAIEAFHNVIDKTSANPGDKELEAAALTGLGESHFKQGDLENAIKYWSRAVDSSELNYVPAANLGELLFSQGKPEEAAQYFLIALKIAPEQADLYYKLGLVYVNLGDSEKAGSMFSTVIKLQPSSELAKQARSMTKELAKRLHKAEERSPRTGK